jgi:6-pyruvoyltetrahydropterin/6-carboxytetrahydropterin synthase
MLITKEIEIDLSHRVPNHKSKCHALHGHRYKIEVGVDDKLITTEGASDEGMVIDFSDLKQIMMDEIDATYDHNAIFYDRDPARELFEQVSVSQRKQIIFVPFIPTAENLAKMWYDIIKPKLVERGIAIKHVKIWETPTSTAIYEE